MCWASIGLNCGQTERSDRSSHCLCEHKELVKASLTEGNIFYQVLIFKVSSLGHACAAAVVTKGRNSLRLWIRTPNDVTQWLNWNWIWIGQKLGWPRHSKEALQPLAGGPEAVTIILTQHSTLPHWSCLLRMELPNTTFKLVLMGYID